MAANSVIPGGTHNNLEYVANVVEWDISFNQQEKLVICDAQTSGGLLISIPSEHSAEFVTELRQKGLKEAEVVGRIVNRGVGGDSKVCTNHSFFHLALEKSKIKPTWTTFQAY
ncbi:MAG: AIR synthase-related protein [Bacteroidales bacterium]